MLLQVKVANDIKWDLVLTKRRKSRASSTSEAERLGQAFQKWVVCRGLFVVCCRGLFVVKEAM